MDGNGRWAEARGLPRIEGHRRGAETVRTVSEACGELGIEAITLYCLSSENWKRPADELAFLMELLEQYLIDQRETIMKNNMRLEVIGRRDRLPAGVIEQMNQTLEQSANNSGMRLVLAIDYGGRAEIAMAAQKIAQAVIDGQISIDEVDEQHLEKYLYSAHLPDPDLLIRTGGDFRVSNFLLWQISYAEMWVTAKHWPEFERSDLEAAIDDFGRRQRRFGGL
jgi:undecaprenyl diphosphate synthase